MRQNSVESGRTYATESSLARTRRARKTHRALTQRYPDARCELDFSTAFELLIATVLSAQTTDVRVNSVTPLLFERFPHATALAAADLDTIESIIKPTGFFRAKARALSTLASALVQNFGGEVPDRQEDLVSLPGVGQKTANLVLGNAFNVPGVVVDTHVRRLARRLGWTEEEDALKIEREVADLIPKAQWTQLSHVLMIHGRRTCHARKPACGACPVTEWCPSYGTGETDPERAAALTKGGETV